MVRSLAGKLPTEILTGPLNYVGRRLKLGPLGALSEVPFNVKTLTEAGVIRLDLHDPAALRRAHEEITATAARLSPSPRINGMLVQPMAPKGVELVIGARIDPQFGPLVVVGSGGVLVELLRDSVAALAPVGRDTALAILRRLKGAILLAGFRGSAPVDLGLVADAVCRVSELIADQGAAIAEIDVNPLICSPAGIVAVDALIVRRLPPG